MVAGHSHSCATGDSGALWCWGDNTNGGIGDGTTHDRSSPTRIGSGSRWARITAGYGHTCSTRANGTLWCWGRNDYGQVGDGTTHARHSPTPVSFP